MSGSVGQLQVAAEAIAQIVQVFQERFVLAFEELEATTSESGFMMPADAFEHASRGAGGNATCGKQWKWTLNSSLNQQGMCSNCS